MRLTRRALLAGGAAALAPLPAFARDAAYPPPDREAMLAVPGGRVYVRVNGDLNGPRPPLVLIHGGPGGTHTGMLDALALADERAVILYDQLDSGRSDWPQNPANWRVARFVDELAAIRSGLAVERWHVCGISWGGTIALEYAARRPAELASAVLGGPLIATRAWLADADALRAALPRAARDALLACEGSSPPAPAACDAATEVFYRHYNRREDASPALRAAARAPGNRGFDQRLYETMWGKSEFVATGTLRDYDGTPLLANLDGARTLFMVGQYDEARAVTALRFAAQVPGGAEVAVIPGAAHGTLSDRPAETVGILRAWLARHDTPAL
ncbi:proline iminopeptidase-family hydrolase [Sphingomonas endophytica]|uniref:Proline iminopeptidase/L-proline amide hydrolase n=1 Tax=Sphingomonas endophytica TaxID=869719 RepID=A0ABR6N6F8_9SPHN|nr:proline iminopeptidase-family hydrolase [Sphingomonas endophytica]MBB5726373.1 proline iminopeptidase/L-proline amide hydrolase [Sphingomonas endophytica]